MADTDSIDAQLTAAYLTKLKADSEAEVRDETADLTTRLYAIHHLNSALQQNPALVDPAAIFVLRDILKNARLVAKRQCLFFFRVAAETLCWIMMHCRNHYCADQAFSALKDICVSTGPHLGGFNQQISLPEITESIATMSALCIAGKFRKTNQRPAG